MKLKLLALALLALASPAFAQSLPTPNLGCGFQINGTTVGCPAAIAVGGTGATTAAGARTALGITNSTPGQLPGTATNDSASAGNVGELITATVPSGSAIALTSATATNLTHLDLTAGEWDVSCTIYFLSGSSTAVSTMISSISATSNVTDVTEGVWGQISLGSSGLVLGVTNTSVAGPTVSKKLASPTTFYCVGYAGFSGGTLSQWGALRARRVR
jgi:hypothetical protein